MSSKKYSRRHFSTLLARLATIGMLLPWWACRSQSNDNDSGEDLSPLIGQIDLGKISEFADGYTFKQTFGVSILKEPTENGIRLKAMSLICTHQFCLLRPKQSSPTKTLFQCPCHGSRFSSGGRVLNGPATTDLPWFKLTVEGGGQLVLHREEKVSPDWFLEVENS